MGGETQEQIVKTFKCVRCGTECSPIGEYKKCHKCGTRDPLGLKPKVILSDIQRAWLASAVDFEGTLTLVREKGGKTENGSPRGYKYTPYFIIANTNREIVEKIKELCGCGHIYTKVYENPKWKDIHAFRMGASGIRVILPQILPYLIIKKRQAQIIISALGLYAHNQDNCLVSLEVARAEIAGLNHRGKM